MPWAVLERAEQWHDRCWNDWLTSWTPANEERLEQSQAALEEARYHVASNDATRRERLAKQQAEEAEREARKQAELDQALAPTKAYRMWEWLVDHPDQTEADFEKKTWPLLRANLIEDMGREAQEALAEKLRRSGRYEM